MWTAHLILILSMLVPTGVVLLCLLLWRALRLRDKRRSPLKDKLLNLPGEHLRKQMTKHDEGFHEATALVVALGPIFLSAWLLSRMSGMKWERVRIGWADLPILAVFIALLGWCLWQMIRHATKRRHYREGLEAELTVAQSLTPLLAEGGLVFHDFPAERCNIDHIVVGRSVVFAIETKSRKKPAEKGRDAARVSYDGTRLKFPTHVETKPIEQARYQAEWLARFLGSGVGDSVRVVPLLALPGWFIESAHGGSRPDVMVSNCSNSLFMVGDKFGPALSESMRRRIAHVLVERYPHLDIDG